MPSKGLIKRQFLKGVTLLFVVMLLATTIACGVVGGSTIEEPKEIVVASTATLTATPTIPPSPTATATTPPPTPTPTEPPTPTPVQAQSDTIQITKPTPAVTPTATLTPTATSPAEVTPVAPKSRVYQLTYTKWDGRYHNLYIGDTEGSAETLIFARAAGPSFSPDGRRLYFMGEQGVTQQYRGEDRVICEFGTISDGIVAIDLMSPLRDICQVQFDAWDCERKQIDISAEPSDVCTANGISVYQNLDWKEGTARWTSVSPDNQAVAFDARPGSDTYRIYFRNVVGTSQQAGIEILGEQGSWSPDSQKMVYRSGRNNQQGLWISNRDDSNAYLLTNDGSDSFPTWSPNGKTIAFARSLDNNADIYMVSVDGQNVQRLTDAPGPDSLPIYAPNGQIIFRSARTGSWGIWIMNGDGSGQHEIIPNAEVGPDWAFSRMSVR